jgi:hypothetical protein
MSSLVSSQNTFTSEDSISQSSLVSWHMIGNCTTSGQGGVHILWPTWTKVSLTNLYFRDHTYLLMLEPQHPLYFLSCGFIERTHGPVKLDITFSDWRYKNLVIIYLLLNTLWKFLGADLKCPAWPSVKTTWGQIIGTRNIWVVYVSIISATQRTEAGKVWILGEPEQYNETPPQKLIN